MMEDLHEECGRCGRKLKNPKAKELGFGRVCYKKMLEARAEMEKNQTKLEFKAS